MGGYMERLVVNRRSCRRFLDKNVEPDIITRILSAMAAAPTGGNAMGVEYTVIDDKVRGISTPTVSVIFSTAR